MLDLNRLRGIFPPTLTPLTPDGRTDRASMRALAKWLVDEGVHGIWALGTTGEFACIDAAEREAALEATLEGVAGRVPVIANISDGSTALAIRHGQAAARLGADAIAVTPPYYYPHSMDEMLAHYRAVRQAIDLPLLIYNIPQTVKVKMDVPTTLTLAREGTVVGIKDSQNDLVWFREVCEGARASGLNFRTFMGTATLIDAAVMVGGNGAIPGSANVAPRLHADVYEAAARGDWAESARLQTLAAQYSRLGSVAKGGSVNGASFSAMKTYLVKRGIIAHNTVALPLRPLTAEEQERLGELMKTLPEPARAG